MKILFIKWNSIGERDLEDAFIQEGHSLVYASFSLTQKNDKTLPEFEKELSEILRNEAPDIVFTVSFFPAFSDFCRTKKIRYVSWAYDSPLGELYSETVTNSCNTIYTMDKEEYLEFHNAGLSTIRYLPMAANTERLDRIAAEPGFAYDVSFVGSLYLERGENRFALKSDSLTDYTKGYVDALVAAQLRIYGYNFIREVLGPVIGELREVYPKKFMSKDLRPDTFYCAEGVINPWISAVERIDLLETVAKNYGVDFFTHYQDFNLPNLRNRGSVNYYDEMPLVFRKSKINLNISPRGMKSGVPLRCFDIMGSGGFLISNFQSCFLDLFVPGEEFIYYESQEDLVQKIGYYLEHEEERKSIAKKGHDKVAASHTYRHRVREMLDF